MDEDTKQEEKQDKPNPFAQQLIVRPEVAEALLKGESPEEIAEKLNVTPRQVRYYMKSMPMADLLEIESRRIVGHMSQRDLGKVKYLALATSLGGMIEKTRLLREQATSINAGAEAVDRLAIVLYGRQEPEGSDAILVNGEVLERERTLPLPEEPRPEETPREDDVDSDWDEL